MPESVRPRVSVVIPTHNRRSLLTRLIGQLAKQTLDPSQYELIVVDDGSTEPVRPAISGGDFLCAIRVEEQENAGAAAARHRGALAARGDVLVFVDDDMQVGPDFLAEHLRAHPPGTRKVVLGPIRPPSDIERMPLFERWHQRTLQTFGERLASGARALGNNLYTGNVSLRRTDYLAVGGFDPTLEHSEDAELGLRLERAGVAFELSPAAYTINGSDHTSLARWRARAELYGICDTRIARKHADIPHASPWRFWPDLNPVSRPILLGTAVVPPLSRALARAVYALSSASDRLGADRLAFAGTTLAYGIDYYRGVRAEMGSAAALLADLRRYRHPAAGREGLDGRARTRLRRFVAEVRADHEMIRHYQDRYGQQTELAGTLGHDAVQKIGLQIMVAVRWMHCLRDLGLTLPAKITSRLIRHLYASDIHWDAEFEPGVVLVHGMGLAISRAAHVSTGCILFHNVTLGMGIDPVTRKSGAPRLGQNVHVMPGATLLGPITIGEGSKIAAGTVTMKSVAPGSVVVSAEPEVRGRAADLQRRNGPPVPLRRDG